MEKDAVAKMKLLWNWTDKKDYLDEAKMRIFLFLNCVFTGVFGLVIWMIIRNFICHSATNAICFIGGLVFALGYLRGFIFLCRR